jgi:hypothetical protein
MQHLSKEFRIETVDHKLKKLYKQTWTDNMPFEDHGKNHPYTRIPFLPDYVSVWILDSDMKALLMKRAYDACAVTDSTVAIHINKVNSGIKKFPNYAELFIGKKDEMVTTRKSAPRVSRSGERIPLGDHRDFMGCARAGVLRERCIYHPWWKTRRLRPQPDHQEASL